ncbi:MAG: hypothetical protein ABI681_08960 [Gemmatimonadales bacterium]
MRSTAVVAYVAGAVLIAAGCNKGTPLTITGQQDITIAISCTDEQFSFVVNPYVRDLLLGEEVNWKFVSQEADFIDIKKKGSGWPYDKRLPYHVKKNESFKSGAMNSNAQPDDRYRYTITGTCKPAGKPARAFELDPEMIIIKTR